MKKITYTIGFAFAMLATSNAIAQQGFGTNKPDKSSAVEIKSPNKGLLIPRISLTSNTDVTTINNPANSLLIYNTNKEAGLHEGYYYYKGGSTNKWIPLIDSNSQNNVTVSHGGQNLSVLADTPSTNADGSTTTNYEVKIVPGSDQQFLATYDDNGTFKTKWVNYNEIITTNVLTSTDNTLKSTVNGKESNLIDIVKTNDLSLTETTLTSTVNGVSDSQDLKPAIQTGQIKYDVTSTNGSVLINTTGSTTDLKKYDLSVNVNAGINVKNGISKDTSNGDVILGGDLDRETIIKTNGNAVKIQGLTQVANMTDQVIAVGHKTSGEVKVATAGQIVNSTLTDGSGTTAVFDSTTQKNKVNLGGLLTEDALITTTSTETLAIAGLEDFTGNEKSIVVLGPGNVLQKASLNTSNAIETKTADFTVGSANETILVDANANDVTITLPAADATNKGKRFYIKKIDSNHTKYVNIKSSSAVDGIASSTDPQLYSSNPYHAWLLQSDGTAWFVVGN